MSYAVCPGDITTGDPIVINGDDCTFGGGNILSFANITVQTGGILRINVTGTFTLSTFFGAGGTLTVQNGGQVFINGDFLLGGGADLDIQTGGYISVSGDVDLGGTFSGDLTLDGDMDIGGSLDLNGNGSLSGDGTLDVTVDINDNGGDSSGWNGASTCNGGTCDPLPVELASFTAVYSENQSALISWQTATEINNEGFYLEKSIDGISFEEIGFIKGYGTTNEPQNYTFTDYNFLANAYYRLRQVDFDGKFEVFQIVYVSNPEIIEVNLFPNPVYNHVQLAGSSTLNYDFRLTDMRGNVLLSESNQNLNRLSDLLNERLASLLPSVYILQLSSPSGVQNIRFIKSKAVLYE